MKKRHILSIISIRLIIVVSVACILSMAGVFFMLSDQSKNDALDLVTTTAVEVGREIYKKTDEELLTRYLPSFRHGITSADQTDWEETKSYWKTLEKNNMELSVIRNDGQIMFSSVEGVIGKNVLTEKAESFQAASSVLKEILKGEDNLKKIVEGKEIPGYGEKVVTCDSIKPYSSFDGSKKLRYYGENLDDNSGIFLCGLTNEYYCSYLNSQTEAGVRYRHIGHDGYTMLLYNGMVAGGSCMSMDGFPGLFDEFSYPEILSEVDGSSQYKDIDFGKDGFQMDEDASLRMYYTSGLTDIYGELSYYAAAKIDKVYLLFVYPKSEADHSMYMTMIITFIMELLIFLLVFAAIYVVTKRKVINGVYRINDTLSSITQGNLDEKADVHDSYEFNELSMDINTTVDRLKDLIAEAEARIDADLEIAKAIQTSALPNVFPPFPERKEFELFASMHAAKEVGGDFYDYYMLDENTLGFLIADVSGKSIPGAMFMMTSKTVIKSLAESGMPVDEVFMEANEKLCEGNDAEMFLTAWMGYLDLKTGLVKVANAGHNPPVLIRDGKAEYVILKPGLMLAGMDGMMYKEQEVQLQKGDILYLYTDGVTEAMDAEENLYGEDRLLEILSFGNDYPAPSGENGIAGAVCELVSADIDRFVQGAEQSDDITMLCVRYLG